MKTLSEYKRNSAVFDMMVGSKFQQSKWEVLKKDGQDMYFWRDGGIRHHGSKDWIASGWRTKDT